MKTIEIDLSLSPWLLHCIVIRLNMRVFVSVLLAIHIISGAHRYWDVLLPICCLDKMHF